MLALTPDGNDLITPGPGTDSNLGAVKCNPSDGPQPSADATARDGAIVADNAAADGTATHTITHGLVHFGRTYGVYYIPKPIRGSFKIGELVLVEAGQGENTGTLVADVSAHVRDVRRDHSRNVHLAPADADPAAREQLLEDILFPELHDFMPGGCEEAGSDCRLALYGQTPASGVPDYDHTLQRLPRVIRHGVNKDKKKVYFSRKRDAEAMQLISRVIFEHNWQLLLPVEEASYQVDFTSISITLRGGAELFAADKLRQGQLMGMTAPEWGRPEYASIGGLLATPLRTEMVEFRFLQACPEQSHLTRHIIGNALNPTFEREIQRIESMTGSGAAPTRMQQQQQPTTPVVATSDAGIHYSIAQPQYILRPASSGPAGTYPQQASLLNEPPSHPFMPAVLQAHSRSGGSQSHSQSSMLVPDGFPLPGNSVVWLSASQQQQQQVPFPTAGSQHSFLSASPGHEQQFHQQQVPFHLAGFQNAVPGHQHYAGVPYAIQQHQQFIPMAGQPHGQANPSMHFSNQQPQQQPVIYMMSGGPFVQSASAPTTGSGAYGIPTLHIFSASHGGQQQ